MSIETKIVIDLFLLVLNIHLALKDGNSATVAARKDFSLQSWIHSMTPNLTDRELRERVAKEVMGWRKVEYWWFDAEGFCRMSWDPTDSLEEAWNVQQKIKAGPHWEKYRSLMNAMPIDEWLALSASEAARHICLSALEAMKE